MSDEGMMGALLGLGVAAIIIGLAICVLMIVAYWKIFTKAGEKGWKSIIPIYNGYTMYKIRGSRCGSGLHLRLPLQQILFRQLRVQTAQ